MDNGQRLDPDLEIQLMIRLPWSKDIIYVTQNVMFVGHMNSTPTKKIFF